MQPGAGKTAELVHVRPTERAGAARRWASWGRRRRYILDLAEPSWRDAYASLDADLPAYTLDDDGFAPRAAAEALLGFYPRARVEHRHVRPAELGVPVVGHFGFFRERFRETLWTQAARWLEAH